MAELFFGEYRFDTRRLALEGPEGAVEVRAKTLQALTYLIEHRNRFVSRAELMRELWPDVHVTDASITQCISELRKALDDSARTPRYIETRVKYGYRFVATLYHKPTERLEPLPPPPAVMEESTTSRRGGPRWILPAAVSFLVLVLAAGGWLLSQRRTPGPVSVAVSSVAAGEAGAPVSELAGAIREELLRRVVAAEGMTAAAAGTPGQISAEISTRPTPAGRLEVVAVLRSGSEGRELWGWTWVVPQGEATARETARRIAERLVRAIAELPR